MILLIVVIVFCIMAFMFYMTGFNSGFEEGKQTGRLEESVRRTLGG